MSSIGYPMRWGARLAVMAACLPLACATRAVTEPEVRAPNAAAPTAWVTSLDRESALVGKVWDVKAQQVVDEAALAKRLAVARFTLLGERHDNPDHHRLQGRVVQWLAAAGRRPAVVLEMLEIGQQAEIDAYLAKADASAAGFGGALGWEKTSWPPYREYQPIFDAAFAAKLPVFGGNLAQAEVKSLVKQGLGALPAERAQSLRLDVPFPAALEAALIEELRASHCGQLPESLLSPMALAQHARDAQLAKVLVSAGARDGAVLIAGGGHVRRDRGVPYYLALDAPGASLVSLGFVEVRHGESDVSAYADEAAPFDFVWFTPRATDADPCADLHAPQK